MLRPAIAIAACWPRRPWASHTPDTTPIVAMPRDGADDKKSPSAVDSEGFTPVGKGARSPLTPLDGSYFPFLHFQYGCFGQFQRYCFHTRRGPPSFAFCVASLFVRRLAIAIAACWPRRPWASHTHPVVLLVRGGPILRGYLGRCAVPLWV